MRLKSGDSLFELRDYPGAIDAYRQILEKHPDADMVPWAMYKIGLALVAQGKKGDAKLFFSEVVKSYPQSAAAKQAKKKL